MDTTQPEQTSSFISGLAAFLEKHIVIYQFMRFACIGFLNTALNFLVLNSVSKALNISQGWSLGAVAVLAFALAVIQSYLWNRTWTFGTEQGVTLARNIVRLFSVGALGAVAIVFVLIGSNFDAPYYYYAAVLVVYLLLETVLWKIFGFHLSDFNHESHSFIVFTTVTLVGLGINFVIISLVSQNLELTGTDLDKNIAAILATCVSLFWNFTGYKVIVFKK